MLLLLLLLLEIRRLHTLNPQLLQLLLLATHWIQTNTVPAALSS